MREKFTNLLLLILGPIWYIAFECAHRIDLLNIRFRRWRRHRGSRALMRMTEKFGGYNKEREEK
jgi:hypothetical protein